jgi:hypothetical protein
VLNSTGHLLKIRVFLGHVTSKFQEMDIPFENTVIYESVLKHDSRLPSVHINLIQVYFGIKYHPHKEWKCFTFTWERKLVAKTFCVTKPY